MDLRVNVVISPPPSKDNVRELDAMLDGELTKFNEYFIRKQRERGILDPAPLIGPERGIVKAYLIFAATERPKDE